MKFAAIGTVSSGTMRSEDLLERFWSELDYRLGQESIKRAGVVKSKEEKAECDTLRKIARRIRNEAWDDDGVKKDDPRLTDWVVELMDALEAFAGPYVNFGSHPGDGADYGFWPDMDAINELPTEELRCEGEDYKVVNDHGNVTVYDCNGKVILELV